MSEIITDHRRKIADEYLQEHRKRWEAEQDRRIEESELFKMLMYEFSYWNSLETEHDKAD